MCWDAEKDAEKLSFLPVGTGADSLHRGRLEYGYSGADRSRPSRCGREHPGGGAFRICATRAYGGVAVGVCRCFPADDVACGSRFGLLSQGKEPRKPWLPEQAQLRAAGGHGVSWQESSIRVFVLSYFTSEQGRHFLPVLFSFPAF